MNHAHNLDVRVNASGLLSRSLIVIIYLGGFYIFNALTALLIASGMYARELSILYYVCYAALCILAIVFTISTNPQCLMRREVWLMALFWFLYIARIIDSCYFSGVPLLLPPDYYISYAVAGCLIPMIAFFREMDERGSTAAYWTVLVSCAVSTSSCVWVYRSLIGTNFFRLGMSDEATLNPLQVAYMGGALIVLTFYDILYRRRRFVLRSLRTLVAVLLISVGFLALIIGASRGPILALAACTLAAVIGRMVSKRFTASAVLIVTLVFIIPMLMNLTEDLGSGLVDRFGDINSEYGEGGRFSLIWEAVSDISESPILGSGLELRNSQTFPHNVVIEAFLTTGIFGGSLFVGLCVWAILRSMRILVFAPQRGWVALLFIFYFVFSEVSGALYLSWAFWYSFAAVMSLRVAAPLGKLRTPEHVVGRSSY